MLKVENISVYYGHIKALEDVSLILSPGEIVAIIGANGAGKSTLVNTISGINKPKEGNLFFKEINITNDTPDSIVAKGIVQVPEGKQLFKGLTIQENLIMGAFLQKNKAVIKEKMAFVYDLFPVLKDRRNKLAQTLSGGEQQMLALARALMANPEILMLDEPSLGIAPILVQQIFKTILKLKEIGVPILLIEQNVFLALKIADRGYVIERGKVVLEGTGEELLENAEVEKAYMGV
jgi:branched-chain amino acid transport system ATP-binding protein